MKKMPMTLLRAVAGAVFVVSGYVKLLEGPEHFASSIEGYKILSGEPARWLALSLPWLELVSGVFLVIGLWRRASLLLLWAFNTVFILALLSTFIRGISLKDCGCFGDAAGFSLAPWQTLVLDLILWSFFWVLWRHRGAENSADSAF